MIRYIVGYGGGVTGATCPSPGGVSCAEGVAIDKFRERKAAGEEVGEKDWPHWKEIISAGGGCVAIFPWSPEGHPEPIFGNVYQPTEKEARWAARVCCDALNAPPPPEYVRKAERAVVAQANELIGAWHAGKFQFSEDALSLAEALSVALDRLAASIRDSGMEPPKPQRDS